MATPAHARLLPAVRRLLARLAANPRANVSLIVAGAIIPLVFAVGFGVDYGRAMQAQTKINAIADSAALQAVSASMLGQTDTVAATAAQNLFDAEVAGLPYVTITSRSATAPTNSSGALAGVRVSTVSYTANVTTLFGGILGKTSLAIGGSAQANASQPPSINFYVVMDTSPSMLLPTTTDGINKLSAATKDSTNWTNGCTFACHTQHIENIPMYVKNTSGKTMWIDKGSPTTAHPINYTWYGWVYTTDGSGPFQQSNGYYADTWWLARNYGQIYGSPASIPLRIDAETTAARNLISYSQNMETTYSSASHPVVYKMAFYTFNYGNPTALNSTLNDVSTLNSSSVPDLGASAPFLYSYFYWTSSNTVTNDQDTDFTSMFTAMNNTIPTPGNGSSPSTPQAVMFIVTDGMADMSLSGANCQTSNRACTQLLASHISQCTAIKNRGIRIAILYTEYLASTIQGYGLSFADSIATNNIPYIETQLKACASTNSDGSQLYYKVSTNQDISTALNTLFAMTVKSAYLAK